MSYVLVITFLIEGMVMNQYSGIVSEKACLEMAAAIERNGVLVEMVEDGKVATRLLEASARCDALKLETENIVHGN